MNPISLISTLERKPMFLIDGSFLSILYPEILFPNGKRFTTRTMNNDITKQIVVVKIIPIIGLL
jgi:hypothetical protein